jgi:hypothetical protein
MEIGKVSIETDNTLKASLSSKLALEEQAPYQKQEGKAASFSRE